MKIETEESDANFSPHDAMHEGSTLDPYMQTEVAGDGTFLDEDDLHSLPMQAQVLLDSNEKAESISYDESSSGRTNLHDHLDEQYAWRIQTSDSMDTGVASGDMPSDAKANSKFWKSIASATPPPSREIVEQMNSFLVFMIAGGLGFILYGWIGVAAAAGAAILTNSSLVPSIKLGQGSDFSENFNTAGGSTCMNVSIPLQGGAARTVLLDSQRSLAQQIKDTQTNYGVGDNAFSMLQTQSDNDSTDSDMSCEFSSFAESQPCSSLPIGHKDHSIFEASCSGEQDYAETAGTQHFAKDKFKID